ncbi:MULTISPECIES: hypothetical protein [Pseudomonas]|uniref:hypothetical protein n=1 Tax=Pseudomonas TaxID=286 RepID=UPI000709F39E|nr:MULTISPECIES: hypothetical protein [Pseudomonas]KQW19749.1 hypothetical protein ASC85_07820 [Pseudomonas sp. Root401]WHS57325.1 hypothetical protein QLH64_30375 [Pseudomonas brassicacearum]WNZ87592.1 hypothetical protein QOM10_30360 [Pseudomonas sp. P108]
MKNSYQKDYFDEFKDQLTGHGCFISVNQFQAREAFERLTQLQKIREKRGYSKPKAWPANRAAARS